MKERRKRCGGSRSSQARAKYDVDPLQKTDTGYLGYRRPCSGVNAIKKASIRPSRRTSLISESRRSSFLFIHRRFRRRPPPRRRLLFFHLLPFLIHLLCKPFVLPISFMPFTCLYFIVGTYSYSRIHRFDKFKKENKKTQSNRDDANGSRNGCLKLLVIRR